MFLLGLEACDCDSSLEPVWFQLQGSLTLTGLSLMLRFWKWVRRSSQCSISGPVGSADWSMMSWKYTNLRTEAGNQEKFCFRIDGFKFKLKSKRVRVRFRQNKISVVRREIVVLISHNDVFRYSAPESRSLTTCRSGRMDNRREFYFESEYIGELSDNNSPRYCQ